MAEKSSNVTTRRICTAFDSRYTDSHAGNHTTLYYILYNSSPQRVLPSYCTAYRDSASLLRRLGSPASVPRLPTKQHSPVPRREASWVDDASGLPRTLAEC